MMTKFQVSYKNLLRKKVRTSLTLVGIALSAWVLASLLGFNQGFRSALDREIDGMGFQMMLMAKGCPYEAATMMLKGGIGIKYLPESICDTVRQEKDVERITPMLMQAVFDPDKGESGGISAYLGVEPESYAAMKSFLSFRQGGWFSSRDANEVVMGYEAAELEQREVGDLILIPGKEIEFTVVGILNRTGTQDDGTIFLPLRTLQQLFDRNREVTTIGIKVRKEVDGSQLETRLYELPDAQVVSLAQVKQTILSLVATARVLVLSIASIAIVIAMVGVINTILMSVNERFREIGILKTIGAMPGDIFKLVWIESMMLCTAGGALGISLSFLLSRTTEIMIRRLMPYSPAGGLVHIDAQLALFTLGAIMATGLLSGLYPAWKAGRIRPLEAIRSEVNA